MNNSVSYHSPKQKRELVAKKIENTTTSVSQSLRHNPPSDIIEPKGKKKRRKLKRVRREEGKEEN